MAYQVGSTEVISNSRVLKNVTFDPTLFPSFGTIIQTLYTSSTTWTKDSLDLFYLFEAWGGGSGGRAAVGGGGGGYDHRFVWASNLNGTYTLTVGSGGAGCGTPTPTASWQLGGVSKMERVATPTTNGSIIVEANGAYRQYGGQAFYPTTTTAVNPGGWGEATDTYYGGARGASTTGDGGNSQYGGGGGGSGSGAGGNIFTLNPAQVVTLGADNLGTPSANRGAGGPGSTVGTAIPGYPYGGGGGGTSAAFPAIGGNGAPGAILITTWRRG